MPALAGARRDRRRAVRHGQHAAAADVRATRLNISLAVTIFSLFFWGALWGVTGMFVAMPLTAMLVIGFSHFEATRPIAILLSRTGALDVSGDPQARD